jgi:predicted nucleic acid-binding protein
MIYLDSGILVKLYLDEPDSQDWRNRLQAHDEFISSALALPEMKSALRQSVSRGLTRPNVAAEIWADFQQRLLSGAMQTIPMGREVVDECIGLLERLPQTIALRTLDALHLATCRLVRPSALATSDRRMRAAAIALAIPLLK